MMTVCLMTLPFLSLDYSKKSFFLWVNSLKVKQREHEGKPPYFEVTEGHLPNLS